MQLGDGDHLAQLAQKLSTITDSLTVLFKALQSLATNVPAGEARTVVQTSSNMGETLSAITGELLGRNSAIRMAYYFILCTCT